MLSTSSSSSSSSSSTYANAFQNQVYAFTSIHPFPKLYIHSNSHLNSDCRSSIGNGNDNGNSFKKSSPSSSSRIIMMLSNGNMIHDNHDNEMETKTKMNEEETTTTTTTTATTDNSIMSRRTALYTSALSLSVVALTATSPNTGISTGTSPNTFSTMTAANALETLATPPPVTPPLVTPPPSIPASLTTLQETISGFISGATITTTKTLVKYPLDTVSVRLQMKPSSATSSMSSISQLFKGSYNGITTPLLSNIPAGALFFAIKDATKSVLKSNSGVGLIPVIPKWVSTCIAVGLALPPYWLLRNPSEVIKTRQQIAGYNSDTGNTNGNERDTKIPSGWEAITTIIQDSNNTMDGIKELFTGYNENILYAYPADVIKFVAYEALSSSSLKEKGKVSPLEGALCGAGATAIAQFVTTPLDVVRNRVMADTTSSTTTNDNVDTNNTYIDTLYNLAKEEGLNGLFAGATPRIGKAILSGAIQFATYEETKESIRKMFLKS